MALLSRRQAPMYLGSSGPGYGRRRKRRWALYALLAAVAGLAGWVLASGRLSGRLSLRAASAAYERKDWTSAAAALAALERSRPASPAVPDGRAAVALQQNRLDEAERAYRAGSEMHGSSGVFAPWKVGRTFLDSGDLIRASVAFRHAAERVTSPAAAFVGLGECELARLRFDAAADAFTRALALERKNARAQKGLDRAAEAKERGSLYYIVDRRGVPLAKAGPGGLPQYPGGQYAAHVVGHRHPKRGRTGLEAVYAGTLPGQQLQLTLDLGLQKAASRALGWLKGSVVILDPRTGEVLAALSQPFYDPNQLETGWWKAVANPNRPLWNRSFEAAFEPGSICKIITAAAALEERVDTGKIFPLRCTGSVVIGGKPFWDWKRHGRIRTLADALDTSCNVSTAHLGWALGADRLFQYAGRFGFNAKPPFELPLVASTAPPVAEDRYEIAERATGLGRQFRITPLQAAFLAAAIANDGVIMRPYIVSEVRSALGDPIRRTTPTVWRRAISKETARALRPLMIETVERGIGRKARTPGLTVAGKTGTSGNRAAGGLHAWFICFAPAENPKWAISILAEGGGMGMDVAAPVARRLLEELVAREARAAETPESERRGS